MLTRNMPFWQYFIVTISELNPFDRMMLWMRIITSMLIMIFVLILTACTAKYPASLYIGKLDTSSSDILRGLFDKLSTSVVGAKSSGINNGVGLTTSEIYLLTAYVDYQVQNVPQFITSSIYGQCSTWFSVNDTVNVTGASSSAKNSVMTNKCQYIGPSYMLNYRDLLIELGLGIVLSYAYGYENEDGTLNSDNPEAISFSHYMIDAKNNKVKMVNLLYAVGILECVTFAIIIAFYIIRNNPNKQNKSRVLVHIISLLKLVIFICTVVVTVNFTIIVLNLRKKINNELDSFGFSFHIGIAWFVCIWLFVSFATVSCLVWTGFEWCITNPGSLEDKDENKLVIGIDALALQEYSNVGNDQPSVIPKTPSIMITKTETNDTSISKLKNVIPSSSFMF